MAPDNKSEIYDRNLSIAIVEYRELFNEGPPIIGYKSEELLSLLLNSIKNKTKMESIEEVLIESKAIDPVQLVDI